MKKQNVKHQTERQKLSEELIGAVEIDTALLSQVVGGNFNPHTTPACSCVPPGTYCP